MKGMENMNVKVENTENKNEVKLTFNIEAEKFEEAMKKVYAKTAKYFNIPGFRKGKAPMQLVERQYGSAIFYEDAFNELVPEIYDNAIKENNVEAVSKPNIDIVQMEKGKELIFTAVVETKPEVELGKYKGIEIKKIEYTTSDKDIEHELGHMAERNARLVSVEDRAVENGDITTIDFEGSIDGVAFEGGKAENHELEIGSHTFINGFEDIDAYLILDMIILFPYLSSYYLFLLLPFHLEYLISHYHTLLLLLQILFHILLSLHFVYLISLLYYSLIHLKCQIH